MQKSFETENFLKIRRTENANNMGLNFKLIFCKFLLKIRNGERNPTAAFTEAYNETLSKHHNFVVRGMVKMMLNALPAQESLVNTLVHAHDSADGSKEKVLLAHITEYTNSMEPVLTQLDVFYVGQKLAN